MALVVRATSEVHGDVGGLLGALRRAGTDIAVTAASESIHWERARLNAAGVSPSAFGTTILTTANSSESLYRSATRATLLGLIVNSALGVVKLVGGIVGNSFALLSDAVNSLGDCLTSIVVLFALRVAQRPPDDEHPYGHTRAEAIAATNVAVVIILSALTIGWEAVRRMGASMTCRPCGRCGLPAAMC